MAKMSLEDLRKLREKSKRALDMRETENKTVQVIVGMGTSGIAAGAKATLAAFTEALEQHGLTHVAVRQTGSLGLDHAEPTVEVRMDDMPTVIYGRVTPAVAKTVVERHIMKKELVDEHVYDRPAADIIDTDKE